ncbi:MAG: DUF58 domain-containing protein [Gammaproteobacteria bacterium]
MVFANDKKNSSRSENEAEERVRVTLKNLVNLAPSAAVLDLHHSAIRSAQSGNYVSRFKGRGMEFDEARLYQPGDDVRNIDWRVTARTGKPHTKLFREERERPVFVSVDHRATMRFATRGVFKNVQAARLAALIAWAAQQHGDRIGGQVFTDSSCTEIKPEHGRHAVLRFLHGLVHPETGPDTVFTLEQALSRLVKHARPGSLVYAISDFRGCNAAAENHLRRLSEHCDVVVILVSDPLESELPDGGRYRLTDSVRDVVIDGDDRRRAVNYHKRFENRCRRLETMAKKYRLSYIRCSTADDPLRVLL